MPSNLNSYSKLSNTWSIPNNYYSENYKSKVDPSPTCTTCKVLTVNDGPYFDRINNGPMATLPNGTPLYEKGGFNAMILNYSTYIGGGGSEQNHTIMAIDDTDCSNLKKYAKCT